MLSPWDIVAMAILVIACLALTVQNTVLRNDKATLANNLAQQFIDSTTIEARASELAEELSLLKNSDSDFIKFLSDSREDAFGFIANVQEAIAELKSATEDKDAIRKTAAYRKLISFLPDDNDMVK